MSKTFFSAASVAALALSFASAAQAQPSAKADISGVWSNASLTPLIRPEGVADLVVAEKDEAQVIKRMGGLLNDETWKDKKFSDPNAGAPEAGDQSFGTKGYDSFWTSPGEHLGRVNGQLRSSAIVEPANGKLPYREDQRGRVESAQKLRATRYATGAGPYDGPEAAALPERCLIGFGSTGGPGMLSTLYNNNYQFIVTKDYFTILVEMAHDARIIPLFASAGEARKHHKPAAIEQWLGDSVGWWEGDTLVTETINVRKEQATYGPFWLSPKAKVTERFTKVNDKEVFYEFIVDDPEMYTQQWKAQLTFRPQSRVYEYACHEGNYGLLGILEGARQKDAEANEAKAQAAR